MNNVLLWKMIELALGVVKSRTSDNVDDKIDEATAIARIAIAARQAYEDHTGEPLDESLLRFQEPIE